MSSSALVVSFCGNLINDHLRGLPFVWVTLMQHRAWANAHKELRRRVVKSVTYWDRTFLIGLYFTADERLEPLPSGLRGDGKYSLSLVKA